MTNMVYIAHGGHRIFRVSGGWKLRVVVHQDALIDKWVAAANSRDITVHVADGTSKGDTCVAVFHGCRYQAVRELIDEAGDGFAPI
jgi:hypothetical protein